MGEKIRKRKLFWVWQWKKEEKWINDMAARGLLLTEVGVFRYDLEEGEPGAYQYCMQMLKGSAGKKRNQEYIKFLKDTDIKCIGAVGSWIYLRRKTAQTPFSLFSDLDSEMHYLARLGRTFLFLSISQFVAGFCNFSAWLIGSGSVNLMVGIIFLFAGAAWGFAAAGLFCRVRALKKESLLRE